MVRAQRTQLKLVAAALVAGTVAFACGGDGGKDNGTGGPGGDTAGTGGDTAGTGASSGALTIAFNPMYSAFDGNAHKFRVPVKVTGATGKLTVSTATPDFVDSEASAEGVTLITRKAGKSTVTIKDASGNTGTATLTVTENDPDDVDLGAERYANGIDAFIPPEGGIMVPEGGFPGLAEAGITFGEGGFNFGEGGFRLPEGGLGRFGAMRNAMSACTFCHIPDGATASNTNMRQVDVEHTPQQTAGYSDEDLINIFTKGMKPPGAGFRIVNGGGALPDTLAATIYMGLHQWEVAPETQKGIVAYLRSLAPKAQAAIDFGGLLRGGVPGGMGAATAGGGGAATGGAGAMDAGAP